MTPTAFRAWRKHMGLSQKAAAEALGISPRMVGYYEAGKRDDGRAVDIPKPVRLSCAALALGISDYSGPQ